MNLFPFCCSSSLWCTSNRQPNIDQQEADLSQQSSMANASGSIPSGYALNRMAARYGVAASVEGDSAGTYQNQASFQISSSNSGSANPGPAGRIQTFHNRNYVPGMNKRVAQSSAGRDTGVVMPSASSGLGHDVQSMRHENMLSDQALESIGSADLHLDANFLAEQEGVDFIRHQTGKILDVNKCRRELGSAQSDKDANAAPVPGYFRFLGRDKAHGIRLDDRNVHKVKHGQHGFIASYSSGGHGYRSRMIQEMLKHSDKYILFFVHSDPTSADHHPRGAKMTSDNVSGSARYSQMMIKATCEDEYNKAIENNPDKDVPNLPQLFEKFESQMKSQGYHATSQTALVAVPRKYSTDSTNKIEPDTSRKHTAGNHSTSISGMVSRNRESLNMRFMEESKGHNDADASDRSRKRSGKMISIRKQPWH